MDQNPSTFNFTEAKKMITSPLALDTFLKGQTYKLIVDFICALQKSVEGKCRSDTPIPENNSCLKNFNKMIEKLDQVLKDTPPFDEPQRFGNKAYKLWYEKVETMYSDIISEIIDKEKHADLDKEIKNYFLDCFGSSKRLDYGTGHELNFLCILLILFITGYYKEEDFSAVVHHVFFPYIFLVRSLQKTYKLEPAGAHGVWGLDEYHFLPFLFGASELIGNQNIPPSAIHDDRLIDEYENQYMYLSCVKYVKQVKRGAPFSEHSPMLETISNVPNWDKVSKGLVKMYQDEVMKKFVVVQHFYFGSILKYN